MEKNNKTLGGYKLSHYVVVSDVLQDLDTKGSPKLVRILFSTRTNECLTLPESVWQVLNTNLVNNLPEGLKLQLLQTRFIVGEHVDELSEVINENKLEISDNKTLYEVVQPSAWCQLNCSYCGQEHSKRLLPTPAQEAFLERTEKRLLDGEYNRLVIGWFGAEPTAGINVMRVLTPRLIDLAAKYNCHYSARIVTNGMTLNVKMAQELSHYHRVVEAEVTIDGTEAVHNQRRMLKSGGNSFEKILTNIIDVSREGSLKLVIRCNVDINNVECIAPLIKLLRKNNLQKKIKFYTAPIHAWGNEAHLSSLTKEDYSRLELQWIALQLRLGFNVGLLPARKKIVCLAVRHNTELVDAFDNSFNCTEVSQVPAYGTPNEYATRLPSSKDFFVSDKALKLSKFNDDVLDGDRTQCRSCKMLPVCGGHCPKAWVDGHMPCPSAKYNIKGRLNLIYAINKLQNMEVLS